LIDFEVHVKKENANLVIKYGLYRLINAVFGLTQVKMKTKKKNTALGIRVMFFQNITIGMVEETSLFGLV